MESANWKRRVTQTQMPPASQHQQSSLHPALWITHGPAMLKHSCSFFCPFSINLQLPQLASHLQRLLLPEGGHGGSQRHRRPAVSSRARMWPWPLTQVVTQLSPAKHPCLHHSSPSSWSFFFFLRSSLFFRWSRHQLVPTRTLAEARCDFAQP